MRTKTVKRYWCDFCNKAGLSAGAMMRHEKHCTMNPNRVCRVCDLMKGGSTHSVAEMVALLPDPSAYHATNFGKEYELQSRLLIEAVNAALPKLREAADDCPACIMAAFRQAKIPLPMVEGFNFTKEMQSIWADVNATRYENIGYAQ